MKVTVNLEENFGRTTQNSVISMYAIDEDGKVVTEIRLPKKKKKRNATIFRNEGEQKQKRRHGS